MVKSPLRYPGGKSRAVDFLRDFIPDHQAFREPFFGGGSVSFNLVQTHPQRQYEASDLNYELYCFWSQLKDHGSALIAGVQLIYDEFKNRDENHGTGKELFQMLVSRRNMHQSELSRAIDFFILNRITFSGVVDSGGFSQGSFEGRFTQSAITRLAAVAPIIQGIEFSCEDCQYLIQKPGEDVFLFLDPPYYSATKSKLYGKRGLLHTGFDHQALFVLLKNTEHRWLMTYDDSPFVRDLYKDFFLLPWQLQYGMTNSGNNKSRKGAELLIANYNLNALKALEVYAHTQPSSTP